MSMAQNWLKGQGLEDDDNPWGNMAQLSPDFRNQFGEILPLDMETESPGNKSKVMDALSAFAPKGEGGLVGTFMKILPFLL